MGLGGTAREDRSVVRGRNSATLSSHEVFYPSSLFPSKAVPAPSKLLLDASDTYI